MATADKDAGQTRWVAGLVVLTCLFWWTWTDRLDLPKLAVLVAGVLAIATGWLASRRPVPVGPWTLAMGLACLAGLVGAPQEMAARVEGWVGWLAAGLLLASARRIDPKGLGAWLGWLAIGLAGLAIAQAVGLGWGTGDLPGFGGRRVVASLGNPGHLGWTLAALLPWAGRFW